MKTVLRLFSHYENKSHHTKLAKSFSNTNNIIIYDNIVFSIQRSGGISVVWFECLKRLLRDNLFKAYFVEYDNASTNIFRKLLDIPIKQVCLEKFRGFSIKRYLNPKFNIKEPYIFHSSYYRTSRDKTAINVTTVHDFIYEKFDPASIRRTIHMWQQKRAVNNSDVIICISENTKRDLLYYYKGVDENKIHVIYNGVSDDYKLLEENKSLDYPFEAKSYCIFVGGRQSYKNFKLAVETIANTSYNLLIVGKPLDESETIYLNSILGHKRYKCFTNTSNETLNKFYNGAFTLLYLSSYEGFGIPCLEAQKAGCPVIAYNASSIPEVIGRKDLLIDRLDVSNVLDIINRLERQEYRKEIVEDGLKFASKFSWDYSYKQISQLYLNELNKNRIKQ